MFLPLVKMLSRTIDSNIVVAYAQCPRKAFLLMCAPERGTLHEYEQILEQQRQDNQRKHLEILQPSSRDVTLSTVDNLDNAGDVLLNATLKAGSLQAECALLEKVNKQLYEPTIFIGTRSINDTDILRLWFIGYVLTKVQGGQPTTGHIIALDDKPSQIKLQQDRKTFIALLDPLQKWAANDTPPDEPPVILNKHCPMCQFRVQCEAQAVQEDNLSRLKGATPKVIRQYEKKGIFTVKQLSYLFRPRKRKKRVKNPPPTTHKIELQALAIRTGRIYLQELPTLTRQETELFLDIESVPDRDLYYLIGLLVVRKRPSPITLSGQTTPMMKRKIWQALLSIVNQYPTAPIYHYGSYELRTIAKLAKRYATDADDLSKRLVNVNKQIYGKIYFPVYSNQLKNVAGFVGATWTSPHASGLQSIVWRYRWDETHEDRYKDMLLLYNEEDCRALKLLVDELLMIQHSADTLSEVDFADQHKQRTTEVSENVSSQFKEILKFAHFNYDSKKIHFQKEGKIQEYKQGTSKSGKIGAKTFHDKVANIRRKSKKIVQVEQELVCPKCGYEPLRQTKVISKRFIVDLVPTKSGIKKTITEYDGVKVYCSGCDKTFAPLGIRKYPHNQMYGHGFGAWVVYYRVALRLPYESIIELLLEQFDETLGISQPQQFLKHFAENYAITEKSIIDNLLRSPFVHVDETRANIRGFNWYVWVFTDGRHVVFRLTDNRETTIVQEFLVGYHGILIADFYPGYDSIQCKQQRCWVHLIRDLNDDLLEHPFDKEYETFVLQVRDLIIPIMEAVQKHGLKKWYLHKFRKNADSFYSRVIIDKRYKSDLVCTYQKRFIRYRDSLFTFWNKTIYLGIITQPSELLGILRYKEMYRKAHFRRQYYVAIWFSLVFAKRADFKINLFSNSYFRRRQTSKSLGHASVSSTSVSHY
jgi:predicted RecB family nuclease